MKVAFILAYLYHRWIYQKLSHKTEECLQKVTNQLENYPIHYKEIETHFQSMRSFKHSFPIVYQIFEI